MAEIPKEATVYVNPVMDWTQTQFVPPIYTELFCGYCETSIQTPDHELAREIYEKHECSPHPAGMASSLPPVQWHESAARASANLLATTAIVLIVFLVLSAVNDWPMPWTN